MDNSCENEDGKTVLNDNSSGNVGFLRPSSNYQNCDELGNLYHNNIRPTSLDSGDVTVEEGYSNPDAPAVVGASSAARRPSNGQAHNIPYMQLFHHLKQKFPDLKDCDINESIQKFGLDRGRCEAELQQRAVAHTSGYYGPWGRSVGNWSTRSSPAPTPTRSDTPFTISRTTPSTPVLSPITSPFASQVPMASHPSQNSRCAPLLVGPPALVGPPTLVGPPIDGNICPGSLAETNCVVTTANSQYGLLVSSSTSSPGGLTTSSCMAGTRSQPVVPLSSSVGQSHLVNTPSETIHTATTKHYVASHPIAPSLNDMVYRQHSTSTDTTITEEESIVGSNLTSPTSTLPLSPSPQPQGRSHSPAYSPQSREQQLQYPRPPVQFYAPPLQQLPPNSRTVPSSQYHHPQSPFVYQTSPHLYGWNPPPSSVSQNYPYVDRPVNELNHSDYPNSNDLENYLVGPGRIPTTQSYSSGVPLGRQEFIPNISSSPASYTTNSPRRSRSTTPGVVLSPPSSAPVVSSSYEPFGDSYLYQHGEARRRCSEHVPLEPVRVAPPPPSAPSARETNYFPGDSNLNDKFSNLHVNPSLLGATPTVPTMTSIPATSRASSAVLNSRTSGGPDRVASSARAGQSSGAVPSSATGLLSEQRARQQRLRSVLHEGVTEFQNLKQEVNRLEDSLALRRQQGERAGLASAQRIEAMQEENRRLQSECDQMEGDILQTGEEPEVMDEEYCPPLSLPGAREAGIGSPAPLSPYSPSHSRLPLPSRSVPPVSGRPGPDVPRRLTPTRTAPPPPVPGATAHNLPGSVPYEQDEGRGPGGGGGGGDDGGAARWSCNRCTYDNHPALSSCEICGAIRMPGSSPLHQPPRSGGTGGGNNGPGASHQHQQAPIVRAQSTQPKPLKSFD